ncbi:hypothetical protein COL154_014020 [Colletotrichum chrysophilum]|nr:hypothetical protein COL154_014020 [Colletotrichum chrysophilum]
MIRLVKTGWMCSSVELANGSRQIIDIFLRGDIIEPMALDGMSHVTLQAVGYATTAEFPYGAWNHGPPMKTDRLKFFAAEFARMRAIRLERVISLGRRDATRRTAHLLLEFAERLFPASASSMVEYDCPLTQADLADTLGMTAIHINRTLRELREMKFLVFKGGTVTIFDRRPVADFAEFNPIYLKRNAASSQTVTPL